MKRKRDVMDASILFQFFPFFSPYFLHFRFGCLYSSALTR
jgi:hypothetical protein